MKQGRSVFLAALAALFVLLPAGQVSAAPDTAVGTSQGTAPQNTRSITREIRVQARVPGHRDIILDLGGNISRILSNTPDDVTPDVYALDTLAENKLPLTDDLLREYRRLVPANTAKYGVLYDRQAARRQVAFITDTSSTPRNIPVVRLAVPQANPAMRDLLMAVK